MTGLWRSLMDAASGWNTLAIFLRLVLAMLSGMAVGIDRGLKRRGAGVKTHVLVCLGSALVMMTSEYMVYAFPGEKLDLARLGAQVISGIGFLGVGTILVTGKNQIRGLTTAAGLWTSACVGLAIGIGFAEGAIFTLIFMMLTLKVLTRVDVLLHRYAKVFDLYIEFDSSKNVSQFLQRMQELEVKVNTLELTKGKGLDKVPSAVISIEMQKKRMRVKLLDEIRTLEIVRYVEEL